MKLEKFTVKDIIFVAVMAAAVSICGMFTMPLVMNIDLFGLRNMASAIIYALFCMITIMKVKKPGALSLLGLLCGFVVLMMAPVMFWSIFLAALLSDIITFIFFRGFHSDKAKVFAATLFIPMSLPFTLIFSMLLNGKSFGEVVEKSALSIVFCFGTVVLSYAGAKIGQKIGKELQKAGKLS
ncbi:MptD family putative ECF transporter S component [Clostridium thermarum]|uniref:MptD family putative ECF transporter S component n=1 Tax=Clostridium thermarum TaxID=1716543 RepID=UPI00111E6B20|nr:MptD family putative ECF transporter S component [Clostridium thermarum]